MNEGRVRAYHPASGNVLTGVVTKQNKAGDVRLIPDGLLEEVIVRNGVWTITEPKGRVRCSSERSFESEPWPVQCELLDGHEDPVHRSHGGRFSWNWRER